MKVVYRQKTCEGMYVMGQHMKLCMYEKRNESMLSRHRWNTSTINSFLGYLTLGMHFVTLQCLSL